MRCGDLGDELESLRRRGQGFIWIGLKDPSAAEFALVTGELRLHPLAVEDAVNGHQRPKMEGLRLQPVCGDEDAAVHRVDLGHRDRRGDDLRRRPLRGDNLRVLVRSRRLPPQLTGYLKGTVTGPGDRW